MLHLHLIFWKASSVKQMFYSEIFDGEHAAKDVLEAWEGDAIPECFEGVLYAEES